MGRDIRESIREEIWSVPLSGLSADKILEFVSFEVRTTLRDTLGSMRPLVYAVLAINK